MEFKELAGRTVVVALVAATTVISGCTSDPIEASQSKPSLSRALSQVCAVYAAALRPYASGGVVDRTTDIPMRCNWPSYGLSLNSPYRSFTSCRTKPRAMPESPPLCAELTFEKALINAAGTEASVTIHETDFRNFEAGRRCTYAKRTDGWIEASCEPLETTVVN